MQRLWRSQRSAALSGMGWTGGEKSDSGKQSRVVAQTQAKPSSSADQQVSARVRREVAAGWLQWAKKVMVSVCLTFLKKRCACQDLHSQ